MRGWLGILGSAGLHTPGCRNAVTRPDEAALQQKVRAGRHAAPSRCEAGTPATGAGWGARALPWNRPIDRTRPCCLGRVLSSTRGRSTVDLTSTTGPFPVGRIPTTQRSETTGRRTIDVRLPSPPPECELAIFTHVSLRANARGRTLRHLPTSGAPSAGLSVACDKNSMREAWRAASSSSRSIPELSYGALASRASSACT